MSPTMLIRNIKNNLKVARREAQNVLLFIKMGEFTRAEEHLNGLQNTIDNIDNMLFCLEELITPKIGCPKS